MSLASVIKKLARYSHWHNDNEVIQWVKEGPNQQPVLMGELGAGVGGDIVNVTTPNALMCKITGGPTGGKYTVDIHANGKDQPATGTADLLIEQINIYSTLSTGTWVLGFSSTLVNYNDAP